MVKLVQHAWQMAFLAYPIFSRFAIMPPHPLFFIACSLLRIIPCSVVDLHKQWAGAEA